MKTIKVTQAAKNAQSLSTSRVRIEHYTNQAQENRRQAQVKQAIATEKK
jgi:hypothetical protein